MKLFTLYIGLLLAGWTWQLPQTETFHRNGKTLIFTNADPDLNATVKEELIETFFEVYPKLTRAFNPEAIDTVTVKIDTAYAGVAYANGGAIVISAAWLHKKPNDTDVMTHEVMHIVQNYPDGSGPSWLTEGIADYVRYKYGFNNKAAGWALSAYSKDSHYTDSYRTTARFLLWMTKKYNQELVQKLDRHMRNNTYSNDIWSELTGQSLEALWDAYTKNPQL